jgi:ABC-2 type transport system permease protein
MSLLLHQTRYDLRAFMRNRQARFLTVALPLILLVIFVGVFGDHTVGADHVKASTYYVPGLSALAVIASSFFNLVISITAQREAGILKRRRATPVPPWVLVGGRTAAAVAVSLATTAVMLAVARGAYGVDVSASAAPAAAVTIIVGSVAFCSIGYALSTRIRSADAAQPMVQAIMLPLYFVSGIFIPAANLPAWLQQVARLFPVEHLADGLHHAYAPGAGIDWADIAVLAVWAAAGLTIALRRFSWTPAAAAA